MSSKVVMCNVWEVAVWRELIERHINAIFNALSAQPITGSAPIEKAVKDLATDLVIHSDELAETSVSSEGSLYLKKVFGAVKTAVDIAVKTEKTIAAIEKLYKLASEKGPLLVELLNKNQLRAKQSLANGSSWPIADI